MSRLIETKLTLRILGGWETAAGFLASDHKEVVLGRGLEKSVGDDICLDTQSGSWGLAQKKAIPMPTEELPGGRFLLPDEELSPDVLFLRDIRDTLRDIRNLLLDIRAGRTTNNPNNAYKP